MPSAAQTLLPDALNLIDTLNTFPAVLVMLVGETYKEAPAAFTVPTKPITDKKIIADNIIFILFTPI